jgi:hypothetical protein
MVARKATPKNDSASTEVAKLELNDDVLRSIASAQDALALVAEMYGEQSTSITDIEIGNGFRILNDKDRLVGVPFVILATSEHMGDYGTFWSALGVTMDGSNAKFIINDGGTGIAEQLEEIVKVTGRPGGWHFPQGLRKSEYPTCPECGLPCPPNLTTHDNGCGREIGEKRGKGRTYYLSLDG